MYTPQTLTAMVLFDSSTEAPFFISVRESYFGVVLHWSDELGGIYCPFDQHRNHRKKDDRTIIKVRRPCPRKTSSESELVLVQVRTQPEQCLRTGKPEKVITETPAMTLPLPIWHTLKVATGFGFLSSCDASPLSMHT
jgi:hypothetical protein